MTEFASPREERIRYAVAFCLFWFPELGDMKIGELRPRINQMTRLIADAIDNPDAPILKE